MLNEAVYKVIPPEERRYFALEIFRWSLGDCSNEGLTSRDITSVLLEHPEGPIKCETPPSTAVRLHGKHITGEGVRFRLVPSELSESNKWVMKGGCFAHTSDSRLSEYFKGTALPIFDRVEN